MGVTLHYRGKLDHLDRLPALCDELSDIAATMGWEIDLFDAGHDVPADARIVHREDGAHLEGNLGLKGISLTPERGGDTLWFCFDRSGNLRSLMGMVLLIEGTLTENTTWAVTKTQSGGPKLHIWIVGLLRYLKKHYISNLEVHDDGGYWDTGNAVELRRRMNLINGAIAWMNDAIHSPRWAHLKGKSDDEIIAAFEQITRETHAHLRKSDPPS